METFADAHECRCLGTFPYRNPDTVVTPISSRSALELCGRGNLLVDPATRMNAEPTEAGVMTTHTTGTRDEWLAARLELLEAEKEHTRRSDELAERRQALPWVRVEKTYDFDTDEGRASLADLFRGRSSSSCNATSTARYGRRRTARAPSTRHRFAWRASTSASARNLWPASKSECGHRHEKCSPQSGGARCTHAIYLSLSTHD